MELNPMFTTQTMTGIICLSSAMIVTLLSISPMEGVDAFFVSPMYQLPRLGVSHKHNFNHSPISPHRQRHQYQTSPLSSLFMANYNFESDDPFQILGMDEATTDKKVIKRAYKRAALKYHPDMATSQSSTPQEKKQASDRFAKINWAYQVLSGKDSSSAYSKSSSSSSSSRTGSSTGGWQPPHRRSGGYSSSTGSSSSQQQRSTDWRDYMPNYDAEDAKYDADGDSFGQIFSDLFAGAAGAAAGYSSSRGGTASILNDFIEFLEGGAAVSGYGRSAADDAELRVLLTTGSFDDVSNEMDDTDLVVKQLKTKLSKLNDEILSVTAELGMDAVRYVQKMELEESLAELNARKDVVNGYLKKAQKRLLSLQTRYKEMITNGENDSYAGGQSRRSSWDDIKREASSTSSSSNGYRSSTSSSYGSSSSSSESSTYGGGSGRRSTTSSRSGSGSSSSSNNEDSWKTEGFGSGRSRRGSGRRRRNPTEASSSSSSQQRASTVRDEPVPPPPPPPPRSTQSTRSASSSYASSSSSSASRSRSSGSSNVPPHRRTSAFSQENEDKRRLRELKVDDEFDKLKKELGL